MMKYLDLQKHPSYAFMAFIAVHHSFLNLPTKIEQQHLSVALLSQVWAHCSTADQQFQIWTDGFPTSDPDNLFLDFLQIFQQFTDLTSLSLPELQKLGD